jgi:hypothetical protein
MNSAPPSLPPMSPLSEDQAFAFLLGELPEAQAQQLEDQAVEDGPRFEELRAFEAELIDAFLAGGLSAARRARVEALCRASADWRGKVSTARALRTRAKQQPAPEAPRWWAAFFSRLPVAVAGGLAVAGALVLLLWPAAAVDAEVSLRPLSLRAQATSTRVTLPKRLRSVKLELSLDGEPARSSWQVVVNGPAGEVWRGAPARADAIAVRVEILAAAWSAGEYHILLRANDEQVAEYALTVAPAD